MVLGNDDSLVIDAGDDFDIDAAGRRVAKGWWSRALDGGEGGEVLLAGVGVRGGGVDADVDVGREGGEGEAEQGGNK